jgi:hypothetical protein
MAITSTEAKVGQTAAFITSARAAASAVSCELK